MPFLYENSKFNEKNLVEKQEQNAKNLSEIR
jgi:hypothetical protein